MNTENRQKLINMLAEMLKQDDAFTIGNDLIENGRYVSFDNEDNKVLLGLIEEMWNDALDKNEVATMSDEVNQIIYEALKLSGTVKD